MLERLEVANLGVIETAELEPGPGLTALTGETGAGKSLLVGSLKLLAGGRASADLVRTGARAARVEAWFRLEPPDRLADLLAELGIPAPEDGTLVLRREVTAEGRSRAWCNDVAVTAGTLARIAGDLVAVHGQHEQHGLADAAVQRRLVDAWAGHRELLERVAAAYEAWRQARDELDRLEEARAARRDRLDAIAFQLAEIEEVAPEPGEDEALRRRRDLVRNAARLAELGGSALARLVEGETAVVDELARAEREAAEIAALGAMPAELAARLAEARVLVEEVGRELQELLADLEHDPEELERIEGRLYRLEQLMLKYGEPLERVLAHREALRAERERLEGLEEGIEAARRREREALAAYAEAAARLDASRREAGEALLGEVAGLLGRLGMAGTGLELRWAPRPQPGSPLERDGEPVAFDAGGVAWCELLIAPNPGEAPRPLGRIASGGELSRIHLAIRTALRRRRGEAPMVLLFDEVDSGLGGATASALGALLADLARTDQVLVVTHLPQVAARARRQVAVRKAVEGGRTRTVLEPLEGEARVRELARMLSGEAIGETALEHARALLEAAACGG